MKNDEVLRNNSVNYIQITTKVYFVKQLILNEVSDKTRLWVTAHTTSSPILELLAVTPNVSTVKVTDGNGRNVSNFNKAEFYKNAPFRFICLRSKSTDIIEIGLFLYNLLVLEIPLIILTFSNQRHI